MTPTRRRSTAAIAAALLLLVSALFSGATADAGNDKTDCSIAQTAFSECTGYVMGIDDKVSPQCCRGLDDVKGLAPSADQRRGLCACILSELLAAGKVNFDRAAALPAACGLSDVAFLPTSPDLTAPGFLEQINKSPTNIRNTKTRVGI